MPSSSLLLRGCLAPLCCRLDAVWMFARELGGGTVYKTGLVKHVNYVIWFGFLTRGSFANCSWILLRKMSQEQHVFFFICLKKSTFISFEDPSFFFFRLWDQACGPRLQLLRRFLFDCAGLLFSFMPHASLIAAWARVTVTGADRQWNVVDGGDYSSSWVSLFFFAFAFTYPLGGAICPSLPYALQQQSFGSIVSSAVIHIFPFVTSIKRVVFDGKASLTLRFCYPCEGKLCRVRASKKWPFARIVRTPLLLSRNYQENPLLYPVIHPCSARLSLAHPADNPPSLISFTVSWAGVFLGSGLEQRTNNG